MAENEKKPTELTTQSPATEKLAAYVRSSAAVEIRSLLQERYNFNNWLTQAMIYISDKPKVIAAANRNPASLIRALLVPAQLKLPLGLNLTALVPFGDELKCMIEYQGYIEVALRHPDIIDISGVDVYDNDNFQVRRGDNPGIDHTPALAARGNLMAAYCVVFFRDGHKHIEYMGVEEILRVRDLYSKDWKYAVKQGKQKETAWFKSEGQMAIKTVLRRAWKQIPKTHEMLMLAKFDDEASSDIQEADVVESQTITRADHVEELLSKAANGDEEQTPEPEKVKEEKKTRGKKLKTKKEEKKEQAQPAAAAGKGEPPPPSDEDAPQLTKQDKAVEAATAAAGVATTAATAAAASESKEEEKPTPAVDHYRRELNKIQGAVGERRVIEARQAIGIRKIYISAMTEEEAKRTVEYLKK